MEDSQKRLIASLKNDPAFKALLAHLDEEVAGMLDGLAGAESPSEVLRWTRLWQVATKLVSRLRTAPEAMAEVIAQESDRPSLEANAWGMVDDDPFMRPNRPVPPPYQAANE